MRFRSLILFTMAVVLLVPIVIIGIMYFPVSIPAVAVAPDPIKLIYRDRRTSEHALAIGRDDPAYAVIAGLLANPGKARYLDPVDYMGQITIHTPELTILFVSDSLVVFEYKGKVLPGLMNSTRKVTPQDREILLKLRARCEKDAGTTHTPHWVR